MLTVGQAEALLVEFTADGAGWAEHSKVVARLTERICREFGAAVDRTFAVTGALVHDLGRARTHHPSMHGWEGYLLLRGLGHPHHAAVCLTHVLKGRTVSDAVEQGLLPHDAIKTGDQVPAAPLPLEHAVVALVDAMVLDTAVVPIDVRYRRSRARYGDQPLILENERLAEALKRQVEDCLACNVYELVPAALWASAQHGRNRAWER